MRPFEGVVKPTKGRLSLYTLGPGFGESSVLVLPEGEVVVVDSCMEGDVHLTLELLEELGLPRVDLLLVTHADLDHVRGIAELISDRSIVQAWRYPGAADVRTLAAKWLRAIPGDTRLAALRDAMDALDELANGNACVEACADVRPWPNREGSRVQINCLAPSQYDQLRVRKALDALVRMSARGPKLEEQVQRFFDRSSRRLGQPANVLSLAVALEWPDADLRIVLGGDVGCGDGTQGSGWQGILATLDRRGTRRQLQAVRAVKVAHHGSYGAFAPEAWADHVRPAPLETWAIIAPFQNGGVTLPGLEVLRELHGRGVRLGICDAGAPAGLVKTAGWREDPSVPVVCEGPLIGLSWDEAGLEEGIRGRRAGVYVGGP